MRKLFSIIFLFGFLNVSVGSVTQDDVTNLIETIRKSYNNIGLAVVAVKDYEIVYSETFGYKPDIDDATKGTPIRKKDLFYIASISKTFVGTAIMQLVENGKISLDDDVNKYLDFSVRNPKFPDIPITIRMLLAHRSSLKKDVDYDDFDKINPAKTRDLQSFYNDYCPGTRTDYSNLGYVILGAVIEKVSGKRFDDYVKKNILKPLRLQGDFDVSKLDQSKLVYPSRKRNSRYVVQKKAYERNENKTDYVLGYSTSEFDPAGGLKISAIDLAKYMIMHMNMGKIKWRRKVLSEESEMKMREKQYNTSHGLSFVYFSNVIRGEELIGMNGANYGIHSSMYFHPEKGYGFVVICNGCNSDTYADSGLNDEVIRALYRAFVSEQ